MHRDDAGATGLTVGDERFAQILHRYLAEHGGKNATTKDLVEIAPAGARLRHAEAGRGPAKAGAGEPTASRKLYE